MKKTEFLLVAALALVLTGRAGAESPLSLRDVMSLALKLNPGVTAGEAQRQAARAG